LDVQIEKSADGIYLYNNIGVIHESRGDSRTVVIPVILVVVCFLGWHAHVGWAQEQCPAGYHCFRISVHLDGKLLRGPDTVVVIGPRGEKAVAKVDGVFRVPHEWLEAKELGVRVEVAGNRLQIPGLSRDLFDTSWDIQLADKGFPRGRGPLAGNKAKRACVVVFSGGEPGLTDVVLNCRSAVREDSGRR
jgi:hypothetical protein